MIFSSWFVCFGAASVAVAYFIDARTRRKKKPPDPRCRLTGKFRVKPEKQVERRPPDPGFVEAPDNVIDISMLCDVKLREVPQSPSEGEVYVDVDLVVSAEQKELYRYVSDEQKELNVSDEQKELNDHVEKRVLLYIDQMMFGHYGVTPDESERQVPVEVKRYSGKKNRRKKKLARQQQLLEELMAQQLLEELMASPLTKYVHLAAHDCGYDGSFTEFICDWLHPKFLSLKTGLSKEDNLNWNNGEAEEYWEAEKAEVAVVVDRSVGPRVLPSLRVFKKKRKPDGSIKKYKSRITVRGNGIEDVDFNQTWTTVLAKRLTVCFENCRTVAVHEDNTAALIQVKAMQHTPRSKFFYLDALFQSVRFREERLKRGVQLLAVISKEKQLGDILTKGLIKVVFEYLRQKLYGWLFEASPLRRSVGVG